MTDYLAIRNIFSAITLGFFLASCDDQAVDNPPPSSYQLNQNFPNPFTDTTVVEYGVPVVSTSTGPHIRIVVYNRFYEQQSILVDKINHSAGTFDIIWKPYKYKPPGLYYIELQQITGSFLGGTAEPIKRIVTIKK